ncbi:MAG TPA: glycoside hydrolase [Terriglobia bacterium]|nr:glycoside hydrolase [Terriglobia bacterium]
MRGRGLVHIAVLFFSVVSAGVIARAQQFPESLYQEMQWRMIGPFRGGRTRALCGVPSQPNVFYIGQGDGGVWRSDDYGRTWTPIFDHEPTQSIGAIAVAPSDPSVIYVGSGEGLQRPDLSVGNGIYRSTDEGKSWTHLGLRDGQQIPALAVDPHDPNRVFAAVLGHPYGPNEERGIFRSTDGGQTWKKVLYKNENTGGSDVKIDPSNPQVVYASLWEGRQGPWEDGNSYGGTDGGLFKSTDGGDTWHQLRNGLPEGLVEIYVAISPSLPSRLYATLATGLESDYESDRALGVYRSDDAGESWYKVTTDPRPAMRIGGGDLPIPAVDGKNPDVVYSVSLVTVRSSDGGKTWMSLRGAPGGDDYQNIWLNPNNPDIIFLVADQGAVISVNSGRTWSSWYNQPTAQLYHVSASNTFPYRVCAGQQESGSVCISSRGNDGSVTERDWHPVGVIEYGYVAPDPLHPDLVYGAGRNEVSKFSWTTGQVQNVTPIPVRGTKYRAERTEPLMFSPLDPHILYYAANLLFKTANGGETWETISPDLARPSPGIPASLGNLADKDKKAAKQRGAIYSLAPSFKTLSTLWAGTDDGFIWITRDGGKNWSNITPKELTPWSKVTQIAASRFDDETAYASVSRLRIDDLKPYIYRTHDGGKTWTLITSGLPDDAPADTVREDSVRKGLLFAGTESGVWVSFDDGDHWQSLQLNLPHTSMRDLIIHENDLIVATHGRSFWILDDISPLREIGKTVDESKTHLFAPAPAYRVRRSTYTDTPIPPDEPLGKNPPDGAILDYYLAKAASGPVTLEILDAAGKAVRRFSSDDKPFMTEAELAKQLIPLYWIRMPRALSAEPGMHRWVWDLHYSTPESTSHTYPISAVPYDTPRHPQGPRALPGRYTVRITVDGETLTAPLTLRMDPRVKTPLVALRQQFEMEVRLASMMDRGAKAVAEASSVSEQLEKISSQSSVHGAAAALAKKVDAVLGKGEEDSEPAKGPQALAKVDGEANSLYGEIDRADAAPTAAQTREVERVAAQFPPALKQWEEIKTADLPALNRQLRDANLHEIRPEPKPSMQESQNEE